MRQQTERILHVQLADYIRLQYPGVIFVTDLSGENTKSMTARVMRKRLRSDRAIPDMTIYEMRHGYGAMCLEIKKEGTVLFTQKGTIRKASKDHLAEQHALLERLHEKGYFATFGVGFEECKRYIDWYLRKPEDFMEEYGDNAPIWSFKRAIKAVSKEEF